jgi:hypothetical protein
VQQQQQQWAAKLLTQVWSTHNGIFAIFTTDLANIKFYSFLGIRGRP